jgi:hypothetical protein
VLTDHDGAREQAIVTADTRQRKVHCVISLVAAGANRVRPEALRALIRMHSC